MNVIQYMLIPVGMSNANTTSDLIFSGITYSVLIILFTVTSLSLPLHTTLSTIALKISILLLLFFLYLSYRLIKSRNKEFVEMYDEIQVVHNKRCLHTSSRCNFSMLLFMTCYSLSQVSVTFYDWSDLIQQIDLIELF